MERRIAEIPASEWDDLSIDLTPREYVLDFLAHAFPVQLQEPFSDDDGNVFSRPVFDSRRQCRAVPGGGGQARRAHPEARIPAAGSVSARPDRPPLRPRRRGRDHRPFAPGAEDRRCEGRAPRAPFPARLGQPRRDRRLHGSRQAHPGVLAWRAASGAAITPISAAPTPSGASTTCWSPAGGPTRRSRGWAGPTARTRPRPRSSGPSPPM